MTEYCTGTYGVPPQKYRYQLRVSVYVFFERRLRH